MTARRMLTLAGTIKGAVNEFLADNCPHLAAGISYYLLLSLFPLVLAAISIFGFIVRKPGYEDKVVDAVTSFIPVSTDFVKGAILAVSSTWGAAGIIATIGLLWAGMAVFNAVRKSLNTAWGVRQPRPFLHERLMEFLMMIGFGALLLISVGLTGAFRIIREASLPVFGERLMEGSLLWHSTIIAISVFITFLAFLFLYKLIPNTRVYWRHAAIGALAAAILFEIAKNIFVWSMANFATYTIVYSYVGTIVALMTWAYVSAVILLFCAKLTSYYPKIRSSLSEEALIEESAREKLLRLAPSAPAVFINMSSLTAGGFGALRRLMLGRSYHQ
ncbi:MAG: YihY/virulence factor BrkB family protein [Dehalococcoidia bacterium]|nr:MAG: YihY/virulence factor BrkB family protein [Dehalococcoidia bacterium]